MKFCSPPSGVAGQNLSVRNISRRMERARATKFLIVVLNLFVETYFLLFANTEMEIKVIKIIRKWQTGTSNLSYIINTVPAGLATQGAKVSADMLLS